MTPALFLALALALFLAMARPASGVDVGGWQVQIHGYGLFGYGETDNNHYLLGDPEGSYEHGQFAAAFSGQWNELRIAAQVEWETSDVFEGTKTELDYAFAEWAFSDRTKLRLGQARHPFGIYGEILDVGTVRPFLNLPVGVYGPTGAVAEHYTGAGVNGRLVPGDWEVVYEVYGGEVVLDAAHPWEALEQVGFREDEQLRVSDLIGGRVLFTTPVAGLSFGVSAYFGSGRPEGKEEGGEGEEGEGEGGEGGEGAKRAKGGEGGNLEDDHGTFGLQVEYLADSWLLRSELVRHRFDNRHDIESFYLELAYRFNRHWQLALRYDWAEVDLLKPKAAREIGRRAPTLLEHEDIGISINYWFNPNLVVKLGFHQIEGNFFARPIRDEVREAVVAGRLVPDTELIQIGTSFSF